jgi:hypothetical protein
MVAFAITAFAHCLQGVASVDAFELVEHGGHQLDPRCTQRMARGDSAPVYVYPVDVVDRKTCSAQRLVRGRDRTGEDDDGIDPGQGERVKACSRPQAEPLGGLLTGNEQCCGAVTDLRRRTRGDFSPTRDAGLSAARVAAVVSGRIPSSRLMSPPPSATSPVVGSRRLAATGKISLSNRLSRTARCARCRLKAPYSLRSWRDRFHRSTTISAEMPCPTSPLCGA